MINWRAAWFAKRRFGNEFILDPEIELRVQAFTFSKSCGDRLVSPDAASVHSPLHQVHGDRSLWSNRFLLYVKSRIADFGLGAEPDREPRNGSIFGAAREGRRGARSSAYVGSRLLADGVRHWGNSPGGGAGDRD